MARFSVIPELRVELDGQRLGARELAGLASVRVERALSVPTLAELTFEGPSGGLADARLALPGATLMVSLATGERLFTGEVTAIEHVFGADQEHVVRVRGYDQLHALRRAQTARVLEAMSVRALAEALTAPLGLTVRATDDGPVRARRVQHTLSDLELLASECARAGLYFQLEGTTLELTTLRGSDHAPKHLARGEGLLDARVELNIDRAFDTVEARGWRSEDGAVETVERASVARTGVERAGVERASVARAGVEGASDAVLRVAGAQRRLVDVAGEARDHVEARARAALDEAAHRARTLVATLDGDPSVRPGAAIEVQGLTAALDGRYVPVRVSHVIDGARGFVTELSTELGPRTPATPAPVATLAKVVAVDDPAGRGRVRVTAPTLGDVESSWLMVALPAAGGERGLVALPSVGDVVLVLFTSDDLDRAIVVGGVFGAERAPDGVVDRDVRGFVLATRGGQRVTLDDGERRVRVEDATGSFVELSPVKVSLHSAVPLEIEAPGQPLVLRAASIDLKRG